MTNSKDMLSGVFVIDAELYEDLTEEYDLEGIERGDMVITLRFSDTAGGGQNCFLHLRRGETPESVAEALRTFADAIET